MRITGFDAAQYARTSQALDRVLRQIEASAGLAAAIEALEQQQRELGFIRADARTIERWQLSHPADPARRLSVQFNPLRTSRPNV